MDIRQIKPKAVIVVKRKWHQPEILAYINQDEVGSRMLIEDFIRALTEEFYGDRTRMVLLSKSEFFDKATSASNRIQDAMKETTAHIV